MAKRLGALALYLYFGVFLLATAAFSYYWNSKKATPDQPIAFPHVVHVNKVGLKCLDCHQFADKARHATAPPISKCMSCHKTAVTDRPEIQKLTRYWEQKKAVEWAQIYKLPDYVYFSHERHVKKGVPCQTCHGQVQVLSTVHKARSLQMGWCVSCHRQNNAPVDCTTCHK